MNAFGCPVPGMTQNCLTVTKNPKKNIKKGNPLWKKKMLI